MGTEFRSPSSGQVVTGRRRCQGSETQPRDQARADADQHRREQDADEFGHDRASQAGRCECQADADTGPCAEASGVQCPADAVLDQCRGGGQHRYRGAGCDRP
jgi:hypothetical protein